MHKDDVLKTTFKTHQDHLRFLVMLFGLNNAPSTFESIVNNLFQFYLRKFVMLYVKFSKCDFRSEKIEYLGHVINHQRVSMDARIVECIINWPLPQSVKELKGLLGLIGYYRRFVSNYKAIAQPLTNLLNKNAFRWIDQTMTS
ncbi:reverse transcriptase [Gossypium australe]|uniref:Reverse transcriptase n=1 Tax=Gossypium australe TaxID=47621 RepID=A0A5B6WP63_9ROSI|nr:reverse transcriptase [Gossypium australe]